MEHRLQVHPLEGIGVSDVGYARMRQEIVHQASQPLDSSTTITAYSRCVVGLRICPEVKVSPRREYGRNRGLEFMCHGRHELGSECGEPSASASTANHERQPQGGVGPPR